MEVFRISRAQYATKLTASGSPGRWNLGGQYVLYTGYSRSLSTLELVVRRNSIQPDDDYKVMIISIADNDRLIRQIQIKELSPAWRLPTAYPASQAIGSNWYTKQDSLILKVPSAIIIQEYNYIINTMHRDFNKSIQLVRTEDYFWDSRLL
jgi:RES domain-containing protein